MNGRERILALLGGERPDRLPFMPITMMFAADRVGQPYGLYARDHRTLVEAQVRTAEEFGIDYVSAISDPAREASDCGADVQFPEDQPPAILESRALLSDRSALDDLVAPDPRSGRRMSDRLMAVEELRRRVGGERLVEGWVEGPCAEAADLRGINHLMLDFFDAPEFVVRLMEFVVDMELEFARAQIDAGADLIGVGDAAASLVGPEIYDEFVWPREKRLVEGIQAAGAAVRLHICGDTRRLLEGMGRLGCEIVDLDFMVPLEDARAAMGPAQVLLGNLDPVRDLRDGTPESVVEKARACHSGAGDPWIVGAGCEVVRDTPPENLHALRRYAEHARS